MKTSLTIIIIVTTVFSLLIGSVFFTYEYLESKFDLDPIWVFPILSFYIILFCSIGLIIFN